MRPELLARYADQRLPRYTSYPTAPRFGPSVGEAEYRAWLAALPADVTGSIYVHIPFCRSMCWYCGCHTTVARRRGPVEDYVRLVRREVDLVAQQLRHPPAIEHIHFGGGTPTMLEPDELASIVSALRARFPIAPGAEIAIEVDPRTLSPVMIKALGGMGFNRASLGVQSFDPAVQEAINRFQSFEETARAAQGLRDAGVRGLNLDLIYGLPHQTVASCIATVRQSLALSPDRLSVFGYAHVPAFKKHQRKIREDDLPDSEARYEQAEAIAAALVDAGYRRIGLDHYALPLDPIAVALEQGRLRRNFQGYTTDSAQALLGFGASAIGSLPQGFVQNDVVIGRYAELVENGVLPIAKGYALTDDDRLRADLIQRVMCDLRVDVEQVCNAHNVPAPDFADAFPGLQPLEAEGIVKIQGGVVAIEPAARALVRTVASAFDAYLGTSGRQHSRTV